MLRAAISSAWARCEHRWQTNSAWVTRFSAAAYPHFSQPSEVCRGSTSIQVRPASSALARRIETNRPQPASLMLRLSPDFARAPFERNCPGPVRIRARVWPGAACWRSVGPPPPAGRSGLPECGPVCGESPCAGWRSCDAEPRRFPAYGRGSSTDVWPGPAAAAPPPIGQRPCGPSGDCPRRSRR